MTGFEPPAEEDEIEVLERIRAEIGDLRASSWPTARAGFRWLPDKQAYSSQRCCDPGDERARHDAERDNSGGQHA